MKSLKQFVEDADKIVQRIFADKRELLPMYHIVEGDGSEKIFAPPSSDKDASVAIVKAALAATKATRVLFIDEAWTVAPLKGDFDKVEEHMQTKSLEQWSGRKEAVVYMAEDVKEGTLLGRREIIREGESVRLGPLELLSEGTNSGRMVGLLPTEGKGH